MGGRARRRRRPRHDGDRADERDSYTFEVRTHNSEGDGAASSDSATPATVPRAPTNLATDRQGGNGFMKLTWGEAPGNGSPILHYYYRYKKTGDEDWRGWYRRAGGADARSKGRTNFRPRLRVRLPGKGPQRCRLRHHRPDLGIGPWVPATPEWPGVSTKRPRTS